MDALNEFFTYVGNQLSSVELTDIIDIVIVAFFLYYLFKFVRDRRAGKLAMGVLLLVAVLFIPGLNTLFLVADLAPAQYGLVAVLAFLPTAAIQIYKAICDARGK